MASDCNFHHNSIMPPRKVSSPPKKSVHPMPTRTQTAKATTQLKAPSKPKSSAIPPLPAKPTLRPRKLDMPPATPKSPPRSPSLESKPAFTSPNSKPVLRRKPSNSPAPVKLELGSINDYVPQLPPLPPVEPVMQIPVSVDVIGQVSHMPPNFDPLHYWSPTPNVIMKKSRKRRRKLYGKKQ